MNDKEFKKTIQYQELAKTNDSQKFMLKTYLDCLLRGSKIREVCKMYAVGMISTLMVKSNLNTLNTERKLKTQQLVDFFNNMKREGKWVIDYHNIEHYDEKGELIDEEDENWHEKTISKTIERMEKTTYYLSESRDIKSLLNNSDLK